MLNLWSAKCCHTLSRMVIRRSCSSLSIAIFCSCSILYISNSSLLLWSSCQCFSLATTCLSCEHWCWAFYDFSILCAATVDRGKRHVMAKEKHVQELQSKWGVGYEHEYGASTEDGNWQGRAWPADEHYAAVCGSIWRIKNLKVTHKSAHI